ncbi:MAG: metallophosphoesterase [Syntrophobacter sp.]
MYVFYFGTLRTITLALAILSQLYLFFRIRRVIRSSRYSDRAKSLGIALSGTAIFLPFAINWYIMSWPISWVDTPTALQVAFFYPSAAWGLGSIFSALLLVLAQLLRLPARWIARFFRKMSPEKPPPPVNLARRRLLQIGVGALAAAPVILCQYGAAYASRVCEIEELSLPFGRSLRVVQLSDIHAGIYMTREQMRHIADQVNALQPDLFVLTGDYITNSVQFFSGCIEEMARVRARYGTFATLGNHEHWHGSVGQFQPVFAENHITLLLNSHAIVRTEKGPMAVAGIDDLRAGNPNLKAALDGLDSSVPRLLLSHRPEIFPQAAASGVSLTLSGHYHGGQVMLSLPSGDISIAHLVTPYPVGLFSIGASRLYVSRGVGTTFTPVRLNAPPEITLFNLT